MQAFITERQVNVVNEEGSTPLMVAAANGRDEIIRLLLEQEVSDINIKINVIWGGGIPLRQCYCAPSLIIRTIPVPFSQ